MSLSRSKAALEPAAPAISAEEAAMVGRARAGDRSAFGWLVEQTQDRVFGLAFRLCRGDRLHAEELAQESFLRALQGLPNFRGDAAFSTWMHRIVVNLHVNRESTLAAKARRSQVSILNSRHEEGPRVELPAATRRPDDLASEAELLDRMRAAFDDLDEPRRLVVLLRDVEGRSYGEIAQLVGVPIGTVRSRLARAREELSRRLGGSGFQGGERSSESARASAAPEDGAIRER
jgi:RNA polymerase sigma-70 factor (ECF subfamily)